MEFGSGGVSPLVPLRGRCAVDVNCRRRSTGGPQAPSSDFNRRAAGGVLRSLQVSQSLPIAHRHCDVHVDV